jgi:pyrroloquinoline quinone biosynthesis protein B
MRARILGSAAGGGLPQWNCGCPNCEAARNTSPEVEARTQDSVLVTTDDARTAYLLNASPDVTSQIARTRELRPRGVRHTPLAAVVLTNADLDHCLGLLSLREAQPFSVYATREVQAHLRERNVVFRTLERAWPQVAWQELELDRTIDLPLANGRASGIELTAFAVPGKLPKHLEGIARPSSGDNVGLIVRRRDRTLVYASSVASLDGFVPRVSGATCLLFDGTFYSSDELARHGIEGARAEDMAHLPVGGERGSLSGLARLPVERRIYTHVNNTNPILNRRSNEREEVTRAGWEVAFDGMEVVP